MRFFVDPHQYEEQRDEEHTAGWEYEEYRLILRDIGSLETDIERNLPVYLEAAQLAERDMSAENLYNLATEAKKETAALGAAIERGLNL